MTPPQQHRDHEAVWILRYLPHGKPVPPGWRLADRLEGTHHARHAVMIVRDDTKPPETPFQAS